MALIPLVKGYKGKNLKTAMIICFTVLIIGVSCDVELIEKSVYHREKGYVTSPGFPSCCSRDMNLTYNFHCQDSFMPDIYYYSFRFSDLDLPQDSKVGFYVQGADGNPKNVGFFSYNKRTKNWGGSYVPVRDCKVSVAFIIKKSLGHQESYAGFKLHYALRSLLDRDAAAFLLPSFYCGGTLQAQTGGQVIQYGNPGEGSMRYCVWQIKNKPGSTRLVTFLRINHLYLKGALEIRRGISSESPLIFEWNSTLKFLQSIDEQPEEGFSSAEGFYVALHLNLTIGGRLQFIYGDYTKSRLLDARDRTCNFDDISVPGFHCAASEWCIPRSLLCDKVQHCSQNEDEQLDACFTTTSSTTTTTTAATTTSISTTTTRSYLKPTWWWENDNVTPFGRYTTPVYNNPFASDSSLASKVKYVGVGLAFFLICLSLYLGYRLKMRKRQGGGLAGGLCPSATGRVSARRGASQNSHPYVTVNTQAGYESSSHQVNSAVNSMSNGHGGNQPGRNRLLPNRPNIYNRPEPPGPFTIIPPTPPGPSDPPYPPPQYDPSQAPPSYNSVVFETEPVNPNPPPPDFLNLVNPPSYNQVMAETGNNSNLHHSTDV